MFHLAIRKRWRILARFSAVLLLGFFLLLISLPNLIDLDNYRPLLLTYLKTQFTGEVAVGKLGLTFQHGPGLRVDGVQVFSESGSQHVVAATAIINFDLTSLLRRHLHLSRLTLVGADVKLRLDRIKPPLADFLRPTIRAEGSEGENLKLPGWSVDNEIRGALLEIVDSSVDFTDDCFGFSAIKTRLKNLNSTFLWHESINLTEFKLAATVPDEAGVGSIVVKGTLSNLKFPLTPESMILDCKILAENLNGGTYFPYYQEYVPMHFIGGRVDIDSNYKGSLMGLFNSKGRIVLHQAVLDYRQVFRNKLKFDRFAVDYDFRLADHYNTIETRDCTINADGLVVKGHCLLHKARRGIDGTIDAKLSSLKFNPVALMPVLPWEIIPDEIEQYCKHMLGQGSLVIEDAYLKGDYRKITQMVAEQPPLGIIGGHIRGENLAFSAVGNWPALEVAKINFRLTDNLVEIEDVDLSIGDFLTCEAGKFSLKDIYHKVQVGFSGYLDCELQELNTLFDSRFLQTVKSGEDTEPAFILKSGSLSGELVLQGPLSQPEKMHWGGTFTGRDIGFTIAGLPWAPAQGEGLFILDDDGVHIESASLKVASVPFALSGTIPGPGFFLGENKTGSSGLNLRVKSDGFTPAYLNSLSQKIYNISGLPAGKASSLEITLSAKAKNFADFAMTGALNINWHDVECSFTDKPLKSLNCAAEFTSREISVAHLSLENGDSEFSFQGNLSLADEESGYLIAGKIFSSHLAIDDFAIFDLPETDSLKVGFKITGGVDELVLPGAVSQDKPVPKDSWRYLYNLHLNLEGRPEAPIAINGCRWQWGAERAQINVVGDLQVDDGLHGDLNIDITDLNVDDLSVCADKSVAAPVEEIKSSVAKVPEPVKAVVLDDISRAVEDDKVASLMSTKKVLKRNNLNLTIQARRLIWQQMVLAELTCACSVNDKGVKVEKLTGKNFEGDFNVSADWHFVDDSFMLESQFEEINFETLNDYLKNPDRGLPMMGGHGSLNLDLYWQGNTVKAWEKSLDGDLDFNFYDGRLKRFSMIANICSILNFSQYASLHLPEISISDGVPYRELTYKGLIVGGRLEFDELAMLGPSFNMFGSGTIDLLNDTVDLEFGVQPLQTVGKVIASIPVLGYIMTGEKKTFVVIPVTVKGPFTDLQIRTQVVTGMGKKITGMVQRIFKTPIRILRMPGKLFNMMGTGKQSGVRPENYEESEVD